MFQTRRARVDPDINVGRIRSRIVRNMIGQYDCFTEDSRSEEIFFVDPYQKFFFSMLDSVCEFRLGFGDFINEETGELDEEFFSTRRTDVVLPVFRVIYTVRHHRGKGIQRRVLEEIKGVADECGESFAIFADPFKISGFGRELNASEALVKFVQNGYEQTDNWMDDLYKQRKRFLELGFINAKCVHATLTEPFQHFVYISKNARKEEQELLESLQVHYYHKHYEAGVNEAMPSGGLNM
jgi:GNAT superfamily N-acetyltransferase